jgi:hypothetical protein
MRAVRWRFALWVGWICALVPLRASAGPLETLRQIAFHPSDPQVMVLRYEEGGAGMLFTRDGGKNWELACDALLFDAVAVRSGPIALANDGSTWMSVSRGLWHDDGHGCAWQSLEQYADVWMTDVAQHPSDPDVLFALSSSASSTGSDFEPGGVIGRDASGTWSKAGEWARVFSQDLRVAAAEAGVRFYVGAITGVVREGDGGPSQLEYATRVSDDEGKSWTEHKLDTGHGRGIADGEFRLQAVDPRNPSRIVAVIKRGRRNGDSPRDGDDSVLVSQDQGAHFTEYLRVAEFGGIAFAPDGRLWIGDIGNVDETTDSAPRGLWFAPSLGEPAHKLETVRYPVYCLGYQKASDTLYGCKQYAFGKVDPGDGTFSELMHFSEVKAMVSCAGEDVAASCEMQLCGAYCGGLHFAQAPVCSVYDTPSCGRPVARAEAMDIAKLDAGTVDASGGDASALRAAGPKSAMDAGTAKAKPLTHRRGGCNVVILAPEQRGRWLDCGAGLLLASGGLFARSRRQERRIPR